MKTYNETYFRISNMHLHNFGCPAISTERNSSKIFRSKTLSLTHYKIYLVSVGPIQNTSQLNPSKLCDPFHLNSSILYRSNETPNGNPSSQLEHSIYAHQLDPFHSDKVLSLLLPVGHPNLSPSHDYCWGLSSSVHSDPHLVSYLCNGHNKCTRIIPLLHTPRNDHWSDVDHQRVTIWFRV